jgi:cobalt-zinc-cadmium resistance protein CzcA
VKEMIQPTGYGQAIITLVYVPLLSFTGVEGKTFAPMASHGDHRARERLRAVADLVPAMIAIMVTGRVQEKENRLIRGLECLIGPPSQPPSVRRGR